MSKLLHTNLWVGLELMAALVAPRLNCLALAGVPTDCRQQLLTAYHKLAGQEADSHGTYHLQFVSTTLYQVPSQRATAKQETTVHGELYVQGSRIFFQTDDMSMWQDGRYVAAAMRRQHTVLLTRMVPKQASTDPRRLLLVRDSLLQIGQLQQCTIERQGTQQLQHIQLGYPKALAARLQIKAMDFWLTPQNTLQQLRVQYGANSPVQQTTTRFVVQERLSASDKLPLDARQQILDEQGQLRPAYRGYRLVNQITPKH